MEALSTPYYNKVTSAKQACALKVFFHHIYEYKKGVRNLILTTEKLEYRKIIENRLIHEEIDYFVQEVNNRKVNVFFGAKDCVEIIKSFANKPLNELTPEQDFILGIMLGYDRLKQCGRYINFKNNVIFLKNSQKK